MNEIYTIFDQIQHSNANHHKMKEKLAKLYSPEKAESFMTAVKNVLFRIVNTNAKVKNQFVERTLDFIGLFCLFITQNYDPERFLTEDNALEHPILCEIIDFLLKNLKSQNANTRLRSCQIIKKILDRLVGWELSIDFCNNIKVEVLERLYDQKLDICLEAIAILSPFQDKNDPDDDVIKVFQSLMARDKKAKVRKVCVEKIALCKQTLNDIVLKIRDVDENTRVAAINRISKVIGCLSISQKRKILLQVSYDESEKVKLCVKKKLLPSLFTNYSGKYHSIMKSLRLDGSQEDVDATNYICEYVLRILFQSQPLSELKECVGVDPDTKLIPFEKLNWETCNYWRILVQYIRENEGDEVGFQIELESVVPELVHFCDYIQEFYMNLPIIKCTKDFLENQFIIKQLFLITKCYDISDAAGRNKLKKLISDILHSVILTLDTVQVIMENIEKIYVNVEQRARFVNELISEIVCPLNEDENDLKFDVLKNKVNEIKNEIKQIQEDQNVALNEKRFEDAENLEQKFKSMSLELKGALTDLYKEEDKECQPKKCDVPTIIKYLDIAIALLLSPQVKEMTPSLETLKNETIYEILRHPQETLQQKALQAYGLLAIIDKNTAMEAINILALPIMAYQNGESVAIPIMTTCIKAMVDIFRIYGTSLVAEPEHETDLEKSQKEYYSGTLLMKTIKGIVCLMDDEDIELQDCASEALCALVLSNRIQSTSVLSNLVLKWANTDTDPRVKRTIGMAMQHFPKMQDFLEQWENTIISVLKVISKDDSLVDDTENIAKFMVNLYYMDPKANSSANKLATKICDEILKKPRGQFVLLFTKMLSIIKIPVELELVNNLIDKCDNLRDVVVLKTALTRIIKFNANLHIIKKRINGNTEDDEEKDSDHSSSESDFS